MTGGDEEGPEAEAEVEADAPEVGVGVGPSTGVVEEAGEAAAVGTPGATVLAAEAATPVPVAATEAAGDAADTAREALGGDGVLAIASARRVMVGDWCGEVLFAVAW